MTSNELLALEALSTDSYVMVNKKLMRKFKGNGTVACFLSELTSAYKYHKDRNTLEVDGSFAIPINRYETILGMSAAKQANALKVLLEEDLVRTRLQGFPAVKYVAFNWIAITALLSTDALAEKRQLQEAFYASLNTVLNTPTASFEDKDKACDNMQSILKGVIIIMSKWWTDQQRETQWTSRTVGQLRKWARDRSIGKPFDFKTISLTISRLKQPTTFEDYIKGFLHESKSILPQHYSVQVHDAKTLLETMDNPLISRL